MHIPEVYGALMQSSGLVLAQELSTFGSVRSALLDPELVCLVGPGHKMRIAAQMTDAVSFIESMRVVHADIACRNFLVFRLEEQARNTKVKLTDFMASLSLRADQHYVVRKMPQATRWCAPETVASNIWGYKTDVWSLGAALWELFAGGLAPWTSISKRSDVSKRLLELSESLEIPGACTDLSDDFPAPESSVCPLAVHVALMSCLHADSNTRPSSQDLASVLKHLLNDPPQVSAISQRRDHTHNGFSSLPGPTHEKVLPMSKSSPGHPMQVSASSELVSTTTQSSNQTKVGSRTRPAVSPRQSVATVGGSSPLIAKPGGWTLQPQSVRSPTQISPRQTVPLSKSGGYAATPKNKSSSLKDSPTSSAECSPFILKSPSGYFDWTPPTRCPSTPDECPTSPSSLMGRIPGQGGSLTSPRPQIDWLNATNHDLDIHQLSKEVSQKRSQLENLKVFLSSPEAVCSLDPENLISMRRKLSAAQESEEPRNNLFPLQRRPSCGSLGSIRSVRNTAGGIAVQGVQTEPIGRTLLFATRTIQGNVPGSSFRGTTRGTSIQCVRT